jgi:hypothetical protein
MAPQGRSGRRAGNPASHRDSIPVPPSPQTVAISTAPSRPRTDKLYNRKKNVSEDFTAHARLENFATRKHAPGYVHNPPSY